MDEIDKHPLDMRSARIGPNGMLRLTGAPWSPKRLAKIARKKARKKKIMRAGGRHVGRLLYHYERNGVGDIDSKWLDYMWKQQQGKCAYCQRDMEIGSAVIEHMVPLSRGGANWKDNVCWACVRCNGLKLKQTFDEFMDRYDARPCWES